MVVVLVVVVTVSVDVYVDGYADVDDHDHDDDYGYAGEVGGRRFRHEGSGPSVQRRDSVVNYPKSAGVSNRWLL